MISMSGYNKYMICPYSFKLHYRDKLRPVVISSALVFGAALDAALNTLLEETGDAMTMFDSEFKGTDKTAGIIWDVKDYDPLLITEEEKSALLKDCNQLGYPGSDLDQLMVDLFKIMGRNGLYFSSMSEAQKLCMSVCCSFSMRKKAELMIQAYTEEIVPDLSNVRDVQTEINIDDQIRGFVDFVADYKGETILWDNKTAKRSYTKYNIESSIQLPLYAAALNIYKVGYIVINKEIRHYKKRPPKVDIQVMQFDVSKELSEKVVDTLKDVDNIVAMDVFPKNLNSCHQIYGKPCDYIKYCYGGSKEGLEVK